MRILTLLVRHGLAQYKNAVEEVVSLFARQLPHVHCDLVVIDNSLPEGFEEAIGSQRILIGGSNAQWEFSAWDSGVRYLGSAITNYDLVLLATSAFRTLYTRYLDRVRPEVLNLVLRRGAAVGHIDYYNEPITVLGRQSQAWLRTSFLFLPPSEIKVLGSLVSLADKSALFTGDPKDPFCQHARLSENYRRYLLSWLTGDGTGQGVEWHSRFVLSEDTLPWFESKVLTILNEHLLGIRLRTQGCAMVDTTWLATRAKAMESTGQRLGAIPSWRTQVTERDTDPVPTNRLFTCTG
jgi:hypothetical protein